MRHYEISEWLDFVHGLTQESERATMQQHLDTRCEKCRSIVDLLQKLMVAAVADAQYQVPEQAVRMARAIYALQGPERIQVLPRIRARLTFDSFREPALAGVRSQQRIARQAMYEAGDYLLDLRIENERGEPKVSLVGQIANRVIPEQKLANVPVILAAGADVLGRTTSNDFGEFQIEYEPRRPLCLYVPVQLAGSEIEIRLEDLLEVDSNDTGGSPA